ncbi:MAG: TolC family protein [Elusimicrobia bacterium]|nr:TolC family protein [Elusimicrobiota bacterium]
MKLKTLFLFVLFVSLCTKIHALTWQEVMDIAKKNNPVVIRAEKELKTARLSYHSSYTNFLPQISGSVSQSASEAETKKYSYGLSGQLSLFAGFRDWSALNERHLELKIAEENYRRTLSDAIHNLKAAFAELLKSQEQVILTKEILYKRENNYDMIRLKYEAGREDKGSYLRTEADKQQAEYDFFRAERDLRAAQRNLMKETGRQDMGDIKASGDFSVSFSTNIPDFSRSARKTPEHIVSELLVKKTGFRIMYARGGYYPEISVSGNVSRSGDSWLPETEKWSTSLALSYSFFNRGKGLFDISIEKLNREAMEEALKNTYLKKIAEIESSYYSYIDAIENLKVRQKYLEASAEQSKIITERYINGLVSYQSWYYVENDYINAQKALLEAKKNLAIAESKLKNVMGSAGWE